MSEFKAIIKGLISFLPLVNKIKGREGGGANYARYCYSVWLRHLKLANESGMNEVPHTLAELGPGDSLGIGIAALLSGVKSYCAFDVVNFIRLDQNVSILYEIRDLFLNRIDIPGDDEFPLLSPKLTDYSFPTNILQDNLLDISLNESNINKIKDSLTSISIGNYNSKLISYYAPWTSEKILQKSSIDFIISQAVLEHVDDISKTYQIIYQWLKYGGFSSHQIDFKSHGYAKEWYGHWCYNDFKWLIIKGKRPYLLNREPYSTHLKLQSYFSFKILKTIKVKANKIANRQNLAFNFKNLTNEDLSTSSSYILSQKI